MDRRGDGRDLRHSFHNIHIWSYCATQQHISIFDVQCGEDESKVCASLDPLVWPGLERLSTAYLVRPHAAGKGARIFRSRPHFAAVLQSRGSGNDFSNAYALAEIPGRYGYDRLRSRSSCTESVNAFRLTEPRLTG